jgi:hypothetical protein
MLPRWDTVRALAAGLGASLVELCGAVESVCAADLPAASSGSAAGDRRQDRQLGAVGDGGREAVQEADVFARQVDVDEAP